MKNGILISTLAVCLAACGGDSDSGTPTINTELAAGIKGLETEPTLGNAEISEGDSASLNTNYTGNVLEDSSVQFSFTLAESKQIALVLSSAAANLDLSVTGTDINLSPSLVSSNELIVFGAEAGVSYSAKVESNEGSGEFQLKFVEANRSSAGLKSNEYLVNIHSVDTQKCTSNGEEQDEETYSDTNFLIINWSEGYVDETSRDFHAAFKSVSGNSFSVSNNLSESQVDLGISGVINMTISTDFETGKITSKSDANFTYTQGNVGSCSSVGIGTGNIIL